MLNSFDVNVSGILISNEVYILSPAFLKIVSGKSKPTVAHFLVAQVKYKCGCIYFTATHTNNYNPYILNTPL